MSDSQIWSIDRVAASNLAVKLGMAGDDDMLEEFAALFAKHRRSACEWAAERVHANVVAHLEAQSLDLCCHRSDGWSDGFLRAEQAVMTMSRRQLLEIEQGNSPSQGQVLRAMVREARQRASAP